MKNRFKTKLLSLPGSSMQHCCRWAICWNLELHARCVKWIRVHIDLYRRSRLTPQCCVQHQCCMDWALYRGVPRERVKGFKPEFPRKWQKHISGLFSTIRHHKSQKIMTYSSSVYGLLTRIQQQNTIRSKLPVPIVDAKQMLSFSTLHKLHHKKYFIDGLLLNTF